MASIMMRRLAAFFAALFALGSVHAEAAAQRSAYPSLAKRPVESLDRTVPAPAPVAPAPADAALVQQVDGLARQAVAADAAFQTQIGQGRSAVAAAGGAAPSSEAWVNAQMSISRLDSTRYDSVAALAGLDTLYVDRQAGDDAARVSADLATIDPTRARILALVDAQNDALDALRQSLRQP